MLDIAPIQTVTSPSVHAAKRLVSLAVALSALSFVAEIVTAQPTPTNAPSGPVYNLTAEQWRADLKFMSEEMQLRHKNLYHTISREKFAAAVRDLDAQIPTLQRNAIIVGMMRIAAMVGDGHTRVDPRKDTRFGFPSLPLRLYLFDDGLFVRAASPQYSGLVGARIEAIGGVPVQEAIDRVSEIISKDNKMATLLIAPVYLDMPDILNALTLSPTSKAATFTVRKDGRTSTVTIPAGEIAPPWPDDTDGSFMTPEGWVDARTAPQAPLWLQAPLEFHRTIDLPAQKALYTQLNMRIVAPIRRTDQKGGAGDKPAHINRRSSTQLRREHGPPLRIRERTHQGGRRRHAAICLQRARIFFRYRGDSGRSA